MTNIEKYADSLRELAKELRVHARQLAGVGQYGSANNRSVRAAAVEKIERELRGAIALDRIDVAQACCGFSSAPVESCHPKSEGRIRFIPDWTEPYTISEMMNTGLTSPGNRPASGIVERIERARAEHDKELACSFSSANTLLIGPADAFELREYLRRDAPLFDFPEPKTPDIRKSSGFEWRGLNVFKTNAEGIAVVCVVGRY